MSTYPSIFNDVIGPVMRGPSSSHCAASLRIARIPGAFKGRPATIFPPGFRRRQISGLLLKIGCGGLHLTDLHGWHRALKMWSRINRGTHECPGLVFCMLAGGSCRGMAYRIDQAQGEQALASSTRMDRKARAGRARGSGVQVFFISFLYG